MANYLRTGIGGAGSIVKFRKQELYAPDTKLESEVSLEVLEAVRGAIYPKPSKK